MHSSHAAEVAFWIAWVVFSAWTVRRIWVLRERHDRRVYRIGVLGFGMVMWVAMTLVAAYMGVEGNPKHSVWFYGSRFLFLLLPLCLWAGYVWGRIMCALFL